MEFYSHPREGKKQQTYLDHQHGTRRVISNLEVGGAGQQNSGLSEGFISQEYGITWVKYGDTENNVETEYAKIAVYLPSWPALEHSLCILSGGPL